MELIFSSCFFLVLAISLVESRQFRYDYKFNQDIQSWIKLHQVPSTWEDARLRCHLEGANLASPQNLKFATVLRNTLKNTHAERTGIFTGIHATFSNGDFHSIEGIPITKMPLQWMPFEPDNENKNENCIVMHSNGTIADVNCNEAFPYVCYRKKSQNEVLTECGTVDRDYHLDPRTGSCYKFHFVARNWTRAFMTCAAEGAYLAIINSDTEADILKELFAKYPDSALRFTNSKDIAFVGFHDWGERNVWTTIHGQSIENAGFNTFDVNQPDEAPNGEFCGGMFRSGKLDDAWCYVRMAFICEKSVDSLLDENE
ncbi:C-type mannose receptor 2-like [Pieris napi]|uniref:C-type mannose receptor 2-like n=1 Tax=Pieris napi TaxID=78633 RepID=UPI001FB876E6|nr:C-type mannose receptor 2-like [Pieris napi]